MSAPTFRYALRGTKKGVSGSEVWRLRNMLHVRHLPTVFLMSWLMPGQNTAERARALHLSIPRWPSWMRNRMRLSACQPGWRYDCCTESGHPARTALKRGHGTGVDSWTASSCRLETHSADTGIQIALLLQAHSLVGSELLTGTSIIIMLIEMTIFVPFKLH